EHPRRHGLRHDRVPGGRAGDVPVPAGGLALGKNGRQRTNSWYTGRPEANPDIESRMPNIIDCPSCRRPLSVPESLGGQLVKCPTCNHAFTAPAGIAPPPAEAPPPPETYVVQPPFPEAPRRREREQPEPSHFEMRHYERRAVAPHRGLLILVLGILGVVCCPLGPAAWIMASSDLREIRAGNMDPEGEGLTQAGRVVGIIATVLLALWCFVGCS